MTSDAVRLAAAARSFEGVPFRLHGRDPVTGLDCVGLVAASLSKIGRPASPPNGYSLRRCDPAPLLSHAQLAGFRQCEGDMLEGDLILVRPSPGQFHLLLAVSGVEFAHAHAGIGRVAIAPRPGSWPQIRQWRLAED